MLITYLKPPIINIIKYILFFLNCQELFLLFNLNFLATSSILQRGGKVKGYLTPHLLLAISMALGLMSQPIKFLPKSNATSAVVPLPK